MLRVMAGVVGVVLLYGALFLHEDEECRLQNILVEWWLRLDNMRGRLTKAHLDFVNATARSALGLFTEVFGAKLVSTQSIAVASLYAAAAIVLGYLALNVAKLSWRFNMLTLRFGPARPGFLVASLTFIAMFITLGTLVWRHWKPRRDSPGRIITALVFPMVIIAIVEPLLNWAWTRTGLRSFGVNVNPFAVAIGVVSNVISLIVTRRLLSVVERSHSAVVCALLIAVPFWLIFIGWRQPFVSSEFWVFGWADVACSNLTTVLPGALYLSLGVGLLAHRIAWPVLQRPLYSLQRFGVFTHRKLMATAALSIIAWAVFGGAPLTTAGLLKAVHGLMK
jgi:hypothetical protein